MVDLNIVRKKFPMLAELALQDAIAEVGEIHEFDAGEMIMDYGDYIRFVPLVVEGTIKVLRQSAESGNELFLYYLNAGETCAMAFTCCMMHRKSEIRTIAEDKTTIISIPLKSMEDWMTRYPSWKNFIMISYNNRFQELFNALDQIAFLRMDERLLKYLANKSRTLGSKELGITHQEIARELNASREAVSRLLKKLERANLLQLGRNKILLHKSPEQLEDFSLD
jgi:CRP/FNR family transcriptional regulator, anaerobic regulatory protein